MIRCEINDVEYRLLRQTTITEHIGNNTTTNVYIRVENQSIPIAGDKIRIYDNATSQNLFFGICGIPTSPTYRFLDQPKDYQIACRNLNNLFTNRLVNYAESGQTLTQVIQDLFDEYISQENITLGTLGNFDDITLQTYVAPDKPLDETLNELADLADAAWNVNANLEFSFIKKSDFTTFAQEINNNFVPFSNWKHKTKDIDIRTVQIILGGTETTTLQSETFTYTGTETEFEVTFPITTTPTILVNDVEVPSENIGITGLDEGDPDIYFLFTNRSRLVQYNTGSNFLNANDIIEIRYIGEFDTRIVTNNEQRIAEIAARTGFSGLIENALNDSTITTTEDAELFATTLLENYDTERGEITGVITSRHLARLGYTTDDFDLLTLFNINLSEIGISGEFVVTERTIEFESANDAINNFKVSLKLLDRNFLRSYAQTFKDINRELTNLNIREDQTIIQNSNNEEDFEMQEEVTLVMVNPYFPTANVSTSDLTVPAHLSGTLGGVYPV